MVSSSTFTPRFPFNPGQGPGSTSCRCNYKYNAYLTGNPAPQATSFYTEGVKNSSCAKWLLRLNITCNEGLSCDGVYSQEWIPAQQLPKNSKFNTVLRGLGFWKAFVKHII